MTHQTTFAHAEFTAKKKSTRREQFLARMKEVIPWEKLLAVIAPHYPKGDRGRPPMDLERMLRVYFLRQWYGLADGAPEDALYDSQALQRFAGIELDTEGGARCHDATQVPPPAGDARSVQSPLHRDQRRPRRARPALARRHAGGRHAHRRSRLDQE